MKLSRNFCGLDPEDQDSSSRLQKLYELRTVSVRFLEIGFEVLLATDSEEQRADEQRQNNREFQSAEIQIAAHSSTDHPRVLRAQHFVAAGQTHVTRHSNNEAHLQWSNGQQRNTSNHRNNSGQQFHGHPGRSERHQEGSNFVPQNGGHSHDNVGGRRWLNHAFENQLCFFCG